MHQKGKAKESFMAPLVSFHLLKETFTEIISNFNLIIEIFSHRYLILYCPFSAPKSIQESILSLSQSPMKMLLRSSISSSKKFFQKTFKNLKSFFTPHYHKLPKTPPHHNSVAEVSVMDMNNNPSYKELEKFYSDFTEQWDSEKDKARRRSKKKAVLMSCQAKQEKEVCNESFISLKEEDQMEKREGREYQKNKRSLSLTHQRERHEDSSFNYSMVEKKLRELEKLDMSNVDYILDIEEVLHYYSRLTCPVYLEIVDKFFMEMYSEFYGTSRPITVNVTPRGVN